MKLAEPYKKIPKLVESSLDWNGEMGFKCQSGSGHEITIDASIQHGGQNLGPRPMELILLALGSCTGMDIATILRKKRRDLQDIKIKLHGQRATTHPHIFENISIEYQITGSDLTDDDIRWAIDLSLQKYCSVAGMLQKVCKINFKWKIIKMAERAEK
jgi:putative redox protein